MSTEKYPNIQVFSHNDAAQDENTSQNPAAKRWIELLKAFEVDPQAPFANTSEWYTSDFWMERADGAKVAGFDDYLKIVGSHFSIYSGVHRDGERVIAFETKPGEHEVWDHSIQYYNFVPTPEGASKPTDVDIPRSFAAFRDVKSKDGRTWDIGFPMVYKLGYREEGGKMLMSYSWLLYNEDIMKTEARARGLTYPTIPEDVKLL